MQKAKRAIEGRKNGKGKAETNDDSGGEGEVSFITKDSENKHARRH